MAKDDERPQFNPKHRIAGAIILVSLAVIFVPMLLDESTTPPENQTLTKIPDRDAPETKVVVAPIVPPTAEPVVSAAPPPEAPKAIAEKSPAVSAAPEPAVSPEPKPAAPVVAEKKSETAPKTKTTPKAADAEKISKGWVVQVGTFANTDNAARLREKLQGQGYHVNSESVTVQGSKAVRLRVGPYRDKSAASKAQTQIQKEMSIQGVVLAYP
jgi:DedD protein